jgi:Bacterial protein of unknown function (DUF853)
MQRLLHLGAYTTLGERAALKPLRVPAHHLTTHCFTTGASGSGKTGATLGLVEEVLRQNIPVLMIDIKGDLSNLGLSFPTFAPAAFEPWIERTPGDVRSVAEIAEALAREREQGLRASGLHESDLRGFSDQIALRIITPGSDAGEPLHLLSSLEQPTAHWRTDPTAARASLSAGVSLILRLLKRDPDAATSRDHVLLSLLAERRLQAGMPSDLGALIHDILEPPIETVGTLPIDSYVSLRQRAELASALNTLLASPAFKSWRTGVPLDIGAWLSPIASSSGAPKTPAVVVSVAHLDDEERALVLGILLEEVLTWVRGLPGSKALRALIVFDEVYGFLPPHPRNPATKPPLVALIKQARAFGVGLLLATQNPMDVDYRVLSNTGLWVVGRLQTDADRERVIDSLAQNIGTGALTPTALANVVKQLKNRWFVLRDVHAKHGTLLMQPRQTLSYMRGPLTAGDLRRLRGEAR